MKEKKINIRTKVFLKEKKIQYTNESFSDYMRNYFCKKSIHFLKKLKGFLKKTFGVINSLYSISVINNFS